MNDASTAESVDRSLTVIVARVGPDVPYFAPPDSKRFDPTSIGVGLAAGLLVAFLKGFSAGLEADAMAAGQQTATWLRERVAQIFSAAESPDPRDEVKQAVQEATPVVRATDPETLRRYAETSRAVLEGVLRETWDMPTGKAAQLTVQVRDEGLRLIVDVT
jgi:hypothetical protein